MQLKSLRFFYFILILFFAVNTFYAVILYNKFRNFKSIKSDYEKSLENLERDSTTTLLREIFNYKSLPLETVSSLDFIDNKILSLGEEEMKKHKVVFAGISRDNAPHLANVMNHIEYIGRHFDDYRVIIFENDSRDATKLILNLWQLINPKVKIKSEDFFNQKRPSIAFLAQVRNKYLELLSTNEYQDFDIVIPLDMDMSYGIDLRGVKQSFSLIDRWDMVCSNGISNSKGEMYDAFAFRNDEFPYSPKEYGAIFNKDYWDFNGNIKEMLKVYDPKGDLIPVHSCFGGLAIYKKKLFDGCSYKSESEDCEHVLLHKCMRDNGARLFMNPAQIIRYEHYSK